MYESDNEFPDDPYKFYFQFDTEWITKYIDQIVKKLSESDWDYKITNIEGFPYKSLPVNSYFSNTVVDSSSLYLGNNYWNEGVWKKKHFIQNKLQDEYVKHLQSNSKHFLYQPKYYKGLYEILN
jgi:hypothetical protein